MPTSRSPNCQLLFILEAYAGALVSLSAIERRDMEEKVMLLWLQLGNNGQRAEVAYSLRPETVILLLNASTSDTKGITGNSVLLSTLKMRTDMSKFISKIAWNAGIMSSCKLNTSVRAFISIWHIH
jgi:hypothetical protein